MNALAMLMILWRKHTAGCKTGCWQAEVMQEAAELPSHGTPSVSVLDSHDIVTLLSPCDTCTHTQLYTVSISGYIHILYRNVEATKQGL